MVTISTRKVNSYSAYPQWDHQGKLDDTLVQAQKSAYQALLDIVSPEDIGDYVGARLPKNGTTDVAALNDPTAGGGKSGAVEFPKNIMAAHLFSSAMRGYQGWQWFVTVSRAPHSDKVTISELGLLPTAEAIVAPEWGSATE